MTLQDVQLNIRVNVIGAAQLSTLTSGYKRVASSATAFTKTAQQPAQKSSLFNPVVLDGMRNRLQEVETRFDAIFRAGIRLMQLGNSLKGAGMFGINLLAGAAASWGDFEFQVEKAGVALSTTGRWQKKLSDAVYQTSRNIGLFDPKEVAKAYYFWGSAAGTVVNNQERLNKVSAATEKILLASAAAGGSAEQSIKGVYSILRQYRMGISKAGDVTEKLYLMTLRTALEFPDLIQAFKYAGPLARSLGMSFEEVVKTFGVLGDLGQRGSLPGRGFAMMIQRLIAPTKAALEEVDSLFQAFGGKTFEETFFPKGQFVGIKKYITVFSQAVADFSPHDRQALIGKFFTQNSSRIMIPLVEKQIALFRRAQREGLRRAPSIFEEEKYGLGDAVNQFADMQTRLTTSWKATVGKLRAAWEPIQNMFGEAAATVLTPFVEALGNVLDGVRKWFSENPEMAKFMTTVLAIGSGLLVVFGQLLIITGTLLLLWGALAIAHAMLATGILTIIAPVVLFAAAIAGVALAVSTNFLGIRDTLLSIGDLLIRAFSPFIDLWDNVIAPMLNVKVEVDVVVKGKKGKDRVEKTVKDVFDPLRRLGEVWSDMYDRHFKKAWEGIENGLIPTLQHLGDIVGNVIVGVFTVLARVLEYVIPPLMTLVGIVAEFSVAALVGGWEFLMLFMEPMVGVLDNVVDGFGSLVNIVERVASGLDVFFSGHWDLERLFADWRDIADTIAKKTQRFLQRLVRQIEKFIGFKFGDLPKIIEDLLAGLPSLAEIQTALQNAGAWLGDELAKAAASAFDIVGKISAFFVSLPGVPEFLTVLQDAGKAIGEALGGAIRDALLAAVTGLNLAQQLVDAILTELNKVAIVGDFIPDPEPRKPPVDRSAIDRAWDRQKAAWRVGFGGKGTDGPGTQRANMFKNIREQADKTQTKVEGLQGSLSTLATEMNSEKWAAPTIARGVTTAREDIRKTEAKVGDLVTKLGTLDIPLFTDGANTMQSYYFGLQSQVANVVAVINRTKAAILALEATSPPRDPKLRHIGRWGFSTMNEYAKGLKRAADGPVRAAMRSAEREVRSMGGVGVGGSLSFSSTANRRITLDVNINDGSGTLGTATAQQIESIFRNDLLADALEHMATVD